MLGMDYRYFINENMNKKIGEYKEWLGADHNWNPVEIGFSNANDGAFTKLHIDYACTHPKKLYRPGNTVIVHFISIKQDLVEGYKSGEIGEERWEKICLETRQISRGITDSIIFTFQDFGREISLLSELDGWSNQHGAEVAGLGKFNKEGFMFYRGDQIGCIGSVVTETVV